MLGGFSYAQNGLSNTKPAQVADVLKAWIAADALEYARTLITEALEGDRE